MRVDLKLRGKKTVLNCEILAQTEDAYDVRFIDKDGKFRCRRIPRRDVEEIRPRLDFR